jgi:hypothetical protein
MYDTYARGMANLIFALDRSSDPWVSAVETLISKSDINIDHERDIVLANGTRERRDARIEIRFLKPGRYSLELDGRDCGDRTHRQLAEGIEVDLPGNSMKRVQVKALQLETPALPRTDAYDSSVTWLSDLTPFAAQRGTGLPKPVYRKDRGFADSPVRLGQETFSKGLGCAANTVLLYKLDGEYGRFQATVGVDHSVAGKTNPPASVYFTAFVDGVLCFESGPMFARTAPRELNVDVRHAGTLMLRLSCNWDDNGKSENDLGVWAEARLVGKIATDDL